MEMRKQYQHFFGFEKDPFAANINTKDIMQTPQLKAAENRFEYATNLGSVYLIRR
jgi:hypothetical protein